MTEAQMDPIEAGLGDEVEDSEGEDGAIEVEDAEMDDAAVLTQTDLLLAREPSSREANFFNMQVLLSVCVFPPAVDFEIASMIPSSVLNDS